VDEVFDGFGDDVGTEGEAQRAQRGGAMGDRQVGFHGGFFEKNGSDTAGVIL